MRRVLLLMTACVLGGCVSGEPPPESRYAPGKVSSRGERLVFEDEQGNALGKWRVRPSSIKVYDEKMKPMGVVRWGLGDDGELRITGGRPGEAERVLNTRVSKGRWSIDGELELERAEGGWLVYGERRALLGALKRMEGSGHGEWALTHDLSGGRVEAADGGVRARGASSAHLAAFTLASGGVDHLHRVAVGVLLEQDGARGSDG